MRRRRVAGVSVGTVGRWAQKRTRSVAGSTTLLHSRPPAGLVMVLKHVSTPIAIRLLACRTGVGHACIADAFDNAIRSAAWETALEPRSTSFSATTGATMRRWKRWRAG